jgi:hypothetical protein
MQKWGQFAAPQLAAVRRKFYWATQVCQHEILVKDQ